MAKENIEKDLSTIDISLRKGIAPQLYEKFSIGFQLLDSDKDGSEAAGVRVFKLPNDLTLYAPLVFVDGEVMGEELLYAKEKSFMFPFEEEWVEYLLSKGKLEIGKPSEPEAGNEPFNDFRSTVGNQPGAGLGTGNIMKGASINIESAIKEADNAAKEGLIKLMLSNIKVAEYFANKFDISVLKPKPEFDIFENKEAEVEVITDVRDDLDEEDIEQIKRKKYVVKDNRLPNQTSDVFDLGSLAFEEPETTGLYQVVMQDNDLKEQLVIVNKPYESDKKVKHYIIVDLESKTWCNSEGVLAVNDPDSTSDSYWNKWFESLEDVEVKENSDVMLVGPKIGSIIGPGHIYNIVTLPNNQTEFELSGKKIILTTSVNEGAQVVKSTYDNNAYGNQDQFIVPGNYKIVKLNSDQGLKPMPKRNLFRFLNELGTRVNIDKQAGEYEISDGKRSFRDREPEIMRILVDQYELSEKDAMEMLEVADKKGRVRKYIAKEAMPMPVDQQAMAGPMPGPMGPMGGPMPGPTQMPSDPAANEIAQMAQQAVDMGHQNLIDAAGLGAMISSTGSYRFADKYMGDIFTAMDRLGKILFEIYTHWNDYKEDIGADDLSDLTDSMVNCFKSVGGVLLKLKESAHSKRLRLPFDGD